jgi:hypothetical protein
VLGFLWHFIQFHSGYLDTIESGVERDASSFIGPLDELKSFLRALLVAGGAVTLLLRA